MVMEKGWTEIVVQLEQIDDKSPNPPIGIVNRGGAQPYELMWASMLLVEAVWSKRSEPAPDQPEARDFLAKIEDVVVRMRDLMGVSTPDVQDIGNRSGKLN